MSLADASACENENRTKSIIPHPNKRKMILTTNNDVGIRVSLEICGENEIRILSDNMAFVNAFKSKGFYCRFYFQVPRQPGWAHNLLHDEEVGCKRECELGIGRHGRGEPVEQNSVS